MSNSVDEESSSEANVIVKDLSTRSIDVEGSSSPSLKNRNTAPAVNVEETTNILQLNEILRNTLDETLKNSNNSLNYRSDYVGKGKEKQDELDLNISSFAMRPHTVMPGTVQSSEKSIKLQSVVRGNSTTQSKEKMKKGKSSPKKSEKLQSLFPTTDSAVPTATSSSPIGVTKATIQPLAKSPKKQNSPLKQKCVVKCDL